MLIVQLFEAIDATKLLLYHFCNGEALRSILHDDAINGHTVHNVNGRDVLGISLTRDRTLNLLKTYAIGGDRGFRLGLNASRLALAGYRMMPVRDRYLQSYHKGLQQKSDILTRMNYGHEIRTDSNEAEELLVVPDGILLHAKRFIDEIAVDNRVNSRIDPDDETQNLATYWAILKGTFRRSYPGTPVGKPIRLPSHIRFVEMDPDRPSAYSDFQLQRPDRPQEESNADRAR